MLEEGESGMQLALVQMEEARRTMHMHASSVDKENESGWRTKAETNAADDHAIKTIETKEMIAFERTR